MCCSSSTALTTSTAASARIQLFFLPKHPIHKKVSMLYAASVQSVCLFSNSSTAHFRSCSTNPLVSTRLSVRASLPDSDNGVKVEYTPWLIVGLGNPGNKYHGTRHNVGFEMIDSIAQAQGILMNTIQSKALIGIGSIGEVPILLAKPQTYMNFCGESVGPLAAHYQIPLRHILLTYDEMSRSLPSTGDKSI